MKIINILSLSLICLMACSGKREGNNVTAPITLKWRVSDHSQQHANESLSTLTLLNTTEEALPKNGWKLYFNIGNIKIAEGDSSHLHTRHVNGDFFLLEPDSSFAGLNVGDSLKVNVTSRRFKNLTDFPNGFYIVLESDSSKGISIPFSIDTPAYVRQHEEMLNAKIYDQNTRISAVDSNQIPPLFPTPKYYKRNEGVFKLNAQTTISADTAFLAEAKYLAKTLGEFTGSEIDVLQQQNTATIQIQQKKLASNEAYELEITSQHIVIRASGSAGAFYAIQSIKTLTAPDLWKNKQKEISLPSLVVQDEPRFAHRAFMLDVARNFQPKDQVKKVLDLMALYKLNVFHFHLVEDEGWRLEIPGLPELTEVGAHRGHTRDEKDRLLPSYGSGPTTDNLSGNGFYSRKDFIEILRYAKDRHIEVITEIETPGHARAAIKAMDERYARLKAEGKEKEASMYLLRDLADKSSYESVQGFHDNVINVALPSVYTFLTKVSDELIAMYAEAGAPLRTIHFGGDEVPNGVWENSPAVQKLMASNVAIKSPEDLWYYYFNKLHEMLASRELFLSGWEEVGLRKVTAADGTKKMEVEKRFVHNNFYLDVWNNLSGNEDLAYKLANAGYKVVLTNVTNMYVDLAYNPSFYEMGQYWGGYVDIEKPFSFIPYDYYKNQTEDEKGNPLKSGHFSGKEKLTAFGKTNIVGVQSPLWAEKITSKEKQEYLLLPKILGLVERAWAPDPSWARSGNQEEYQKAWSAFLHTVAKRELARLDFYNGGYLYRVSTPGVKKIGDKIHANIQLPGFTIHYTTDGSEPTIKSPVYKDPLPFEKGMKFSAFNNQGRSGRSVQL
ncbi:family 20 glycosylhydrolase [Olivibacter domesticus]|uniref:beta-N-acetylhexosaminidase n=1 Tax=Olivibacter domesticus TaxID=407022 RepID=A0A1H7J945_OLID1|nr:family 20 glycosylhydrolase [Olivibacter domesticus]SEK71126.1 hexosaminidase [Olivibacter domesticus]